MRIKLPSAVCLFQVALTTSLLAACGADKPNSDTQADVVVRSAKLVELGHEDEAAFLNYPAVIQSQQLSDLSFEVGGVLKELAVIEAQTVKKGDVLAMLDQRDLMAKLKTAQAQHDNAEAEYQRAASLMEEDAISRSVLEQRKSKRDVSQAGLETAEKALQDSVLVAPYDGNVATVDTKEQQSVQAGKTVITILGKGGLEATINMPSSILASISGKNRLATSSYIVMDAMPERHFPAVYKELALKADDASQTYKMTFTFEAPDGAIILPGMNATVWFEDPSKASTSIDQVTIPLTAIATDGDQKYVWVVDRESMLVSRRNVTVEDNIGVGLKVLSGLEVGETIVAAGVSSLSEGMAVRPWSKQ